MAIGTYRATYIPDHFWPTAAEALAAVLHKFQATQERHLRYHCNSINSIESNRLN